MRFFHLAKKRSATETMLSALSATDAAIMADPKLSSGRARGSPDSLASDSDITTRKSPTSKYLYIEVTSIKWDDDESERLMGLHKFFTGGECSYCRYS